MKELGGSKDGQPTKPESTRTIHPVSDIQRSKISLPPDKKSLGEMINGSRDTDTYDRMFQKDPERATKSVETDRKRFGEILTDALTASGYTPPADKMTILNVGCGVCLEAPGLVKQFGGTEENPREVNIIGIDPIEKRIAIAQENTNTLPGNHTFIVGDARKDLTEYPDIPEKVDMALLRRQNIFLGGIGNPKPWEKIFSNTLERVRPGGIVVVTSVSEEEHGRMLEAFKDLGYEPDPAVGPLTRYYKESDDENYGFHIDHSIAVFHKPAPETE